MLLDFADLNRGQTYQVMTHSIIPRPIAWILTRNENGSHNLAPFSFFQAVGSQPPTVMFSLGDLPSGEKKDTQRNFQREQRCVLHIATADLAEQMNLSAKPLPFGESEADLCGLELAEVDGWPLPRIKAAPVAYLCALVKVDKVAGMNVIFAELLHGWFNDDILAPAPMPNTPDLVVPEKLNSLARLGYMSYAPLGERFELERPT